MRPISWPRSYLHFLSSGWPPIYLNPSPCVTSPHDTQQGLGLWNHPQEEGPGELPLGHEPLFLLLSDYSLKDVHACAKAGFRIGAAFKAAYLKLGVSMALCEGVLRDIKGEWQGHVTSMPIFFPSLAPPGPRRSLS